MKTYQPRNRGHKLAGVLVKLGMMAALLVVLSSQGLESAVGTNLQTEIVITPLKDNTLYEATANFVSNGAGPNFYVGRTNQGAIRRGLIAFDIAAQVPADSTIISVTLTLRQTRSPDQTAQPIALHRALANWGEGSSNAGQNGGGGAAATIGDATWVHTFFDTTQWATTGGDFATTASATTTVTGSTAYTWSTPEMVADVQGWLDDPENNFGWVVIGNEASSRTARQFASRENSDASARPQLTILYSGPQGEQFIVHLPFIER